MLIAFLDVLLNHFGALKTTEATLPRLLPFAIESTWITSKWDLLEKYLAMQPDHAGGDFNIGVGSALNALKKGKSKLFKRTIGDLRRIVAKGLTSGSVISFQASHDSVMKLHVLAEIELLADTRTTEDADRMAVFGILDRRLEMLGGGISDKMYLLGVRRAAMELS
jgi:serine/threonine-protein kinase ATR